MAIRLTRLILRSCVLSLVLTLAITTVCSFVHTLGVRDRASLRYLQKSTSLKISLWEADLAFNLGEDDGAEIDENSSKTVHHKQARQIEIIKYKEQMPKNKIWCPFQFYLYQLQNSFSDPATKALHMDDELKRMESKYHQLGGDDLPRICFPLGRGLGHYSGNLVRPNERSYELVLRAYSKANLGREGAEFAEAIVARYEKLNPSKQATTKMIAFVMKAWIAAMNLERSEYWLHLIESRYEANHFVSDFPGYYFYNPFIIGLKRMTDVSHRTAAKRSMQILDKIDELSDSTNNFDLLPGRAIYLDIMKYQEYGYKGSAAFFRIEKVFLQLQKQYRSSGYHPRLKPSVEALTPVFVAASKCHFPTDDRVIYQVNALFDEIDQLYKETGDPDFMPNAAICNSLNSIYARMNRHRMNLSEFTERTTMLLQRMEEYKIKFKDPRDKTSAFNRILHAAESQLPDDPMSEPVNTKEIFTIVLNTFKKFHDENGEVKPLPNAATYQIFLRACAKLPEGEARFKLAAKAFQLCQQKNFVTVDTIFKLYDAYPEHAISLLNSTNYLGFDKDMFLILNLDS